MIKAVVFDFGQTLVDSAGGFRAAEKEAQEKIITDLGLVDKEEFLRHYRRIRKECHERSQLSRKKIWEEVYWYFCRASDDEKLQMWEDEYWKTVKGHTKVFPEVEKVLGELAGRFKLALITNTQGQERNANHRISGYPELEKYFEVVMVAGEKGVPSKPDLMPFKLCLEQLGVSAQEAVYVGDDVRVDIEGAQKVGMRAVWIKHHSVKRNWQEVEISIPVITNLEELLDIIS
jgi:HAD superfamily hydrolase (TIGR01549 family)